MSVDRLKSQRLEQLWKLLADIYSPERKKRVNQMHKSVKSDAKEVLISDPEKRGRVLVDLIH